MIAKDMLGREIKAGDTIAYALTVGRSANLALYKVLEVVDCKDYWGNEYAKLKAQKLKQSYGGKQERPATLAMADARALVVNEVKL